MSSIIFHWDTPKGFESPHAKKKLLARWMLTAKAFGINTLYCVTDEPLTVNDTEVMFTVCETLEQAVIKAGGHTVYVEQGGMPLQGFLHPHNATYVFGSDYEGLSVKGAITIDSKLPIHAEIAAGIVLHHRSRQWP